MTEATTNVRRLVAQIPLLDQEHIFALFQEDLSDVPEEELALKLKARLLLLPSYAHQAFTESIRHSMHPKNRQIGSLMRVIETYSPQSKDTGQKDTVLQHEPQRQQLQTIDMSRIEKDEINPVRLQAVSKDVEQRRRVDLMKQMMAQAQRTDAQDIFDEADAKEVEQYREAGQGFRSHQFDEILGSMKQEVSLQFSDDMMQRRFDNVCLAYLKDVRDESQTRSLLERNPAVGGLGLSEQQRNAVMTLLGQGKKGVAAEQRNTSRAPAVQPQSQRAPLDATVETKQRPPQPPRTDASQAGMLHHINVALFQQGQQGGVAQSFPQASRIIPLQPAAAQRPEDRETVFTAALRQQSAGSRTVAPGQTSAYEQPSQWRAAPQPSVAAARARASASSRPVAADVRPPGTRVPEVRFPASMPRASVQMPTKQMLVGPVQEIGLLSVKDVRREKDGPRAFMNRIVAKVKSIEKISMERRVAALEAWKTSPLYRAYTDILNESFERGMSPDVVIAEKKQQDNDALSAVEFQTIADLTDQIRI